MAQRPPPTMTSCVGPEQPQELLDQVTTVHPCTTAQSPAPMSAGRLPRTHWGISGDGTCMDFFLLASQATRGGPDDRLCFVEPSLTPASTCFRHFTFAQLTKVRDWLARPGCDPLVGGKIARGPPGRPRGKALRCSA